MAALHSAGMPVPRPVAIADDPRIIGAPFFLAEFVQGLVVRDTADAQSLSYDDAAKVSDDLVDQLVRLHGIDPTEVGLSNLGRPTGFLGRQVRRWLDQWHMSGGDNEGGQFERVAKLLEAKMPTTRRTSVLHGDYRLDNTILSSATRGRIGAIVDWEMATLGDPLADFGLMLAYWDPCSASVTGTDHPVTALPGFATKEDLVSRYERRSGLPLDSLPWYEAFGFFKLAAIAQTINARADDTDGTFVRVATADLIRRSFDALSIER
jgi:aminoglycoside phosphotransferase (APT) family kinase protein